MKKQKNCTLSLLLITLLFAAFGLKAQDTVVKTNGQVISCFILEVGNNGVSYKRAEVKDGTNLHRFKK